ncbi:LPXTG cell wall anchor domain-containing protein, partial [Slackia isoflavoniconvertens]|uniref:LPXTG cell wall anchor domain-containing protein n=2 Tax=Slackia isoflavoniconvertens TaxID=572010 RepID=UPI003AF0BFF7
DTGSATDPVLKPATTTPRTAATTKTTVAKSTASTPSRAKTASAATATLPKTANNNWIAASLALFLLGTALLGRPKRKGD